MRHTAQVRRTRLGVAGAVAALSVGILGACTGEAADPTTSTPTSSASSSSASPTSPATSASPSPTSAYVPVKPKFPAAAKKQTDAGAVAFVEYYWEAVDFAWSKPDSEILDGLSTTACESCSQLIESAKQSVKAKQTATGPILDVSGISIVSKPIGLIHLICDVRQYDVSYVNPTGEVVYEQEAKTLSRALEVVWRDGWKVQELGTR